MIGAKNNVVVSSGRPECTASSSNCRLKDPQLRMADDCGDQRCFSIRLSVLDDPKRCGNDAFRLGVDLGSCTGDQGRPSKPYCKASNVALAGFGAQKKLKKNATRTQKRWAGVDSVRSVGGQPNRVSITRWRLLS